VWRSSASTGTPARGAEPDRSGGRVDAALGQLCGGLIQELLAMVRGPAIRWGAVTGRLELLSPHPPSRRARGESWRVAAHMRQRGRPVRGSTVDGVMGWPARGLGLGSIRGVGSGGRGGGAEDGSPVRGSGGDGTPSGDLGSVEPVCASAGAAASMTAASARATFSSTCHCGPPVISAPAGGRRRGQCARVDECVPT
jgi:hypothetical protein